jgi:hypothetical protein
MTILINISCKPVRRKETEIYMPLLTVYEETVK